MKIPCVKEKGLEIFTTTADERLTLGESMFLNTHYTSRFRRYRGEKLIEKWTENDMLESLKSKCDKASGNRVYVLFGAAGSGKSETIRWLEILLKSENYSRPFIRISRTELDPVKILQKVLGLAGKELNSDTIIRWEILKNKPVTLANSIVWNSLSMLLDSDESIIPISYKLRPLIEDNLRNSFTDVSKSDELKKRTVELISVEELEEVIKNCALPININYEQLRKHLVERLESEVLGEYGFVNTLKEVGANIYDRTGKRPVLLIDDLVQSMNIYASDLLDYFITFEEGSWDIIIGLTPASFETTKRGRELLTRINYLDTFDDRLYKLWLTDEFGNESYTINSDNVSEYIMSYLVQFKKINGYECNKTCSNYLKCLSLQWGEENDICLTPLNKHLINRIFMNLFKSKGQSRHFIMTVGEYIKSLIDKKELEFLSTRIKRENCIDIDDINKKIFIESFMPVNSSKQMEIPGDFLRLCGFKWSGKESVEVTSLVKSSVTYQPNDFTTINSEQPGISAVRDWLEGKDINKELLKNFRIMCYGFLKEVTQKIDLSRPNTSKNFGCIRKERTVEGCKLPLKIEGIDDFEGIEVKKDLGYQAVEYMQVKDANEESQMNLVNHLMNNLNVQRMVHQTNNLNKLNVGIFEKQISISSCELAFLLYVFTYTTHELKNIPILITKKYNELGMKGIKDIWPCEIQDFTDNEIQFINSFFCDWFELRENFYDGFQLRIYTEKYNSIIDVSNRLVEIETDDLSEDYMTGNTTVKDLLSSILLKVKGFHNVITDNEFKDCCSQMINTIEILKNSDYNKFREVQDKLEDIKKEYIEFGKILNIPDVFKEREHKSFLNKTQEISYDYPDFIQSVSLIIKSPVYNWYSHFEKIQIQLWDDYSYLYETLLNRFKCFGYEETSAPNPNITELKFKKSNMRDICEMVTTAGEFLDKIKGISGKLRRITIIDRFIDVELLNRIKAFEKFLKSIDRFLTLNEIEELMINHYYDSANNILLTLSDVFNPETVNNSEEIITVERIQMFSDRSLGEIISKIYRILTGKVKLYYEFYKISGDEANMLRAGDAVQFLKKPYDIRKCYLSSELEECLNELYESFPSQKKVYNLFSSIGLSTITSKWVSHIYKEGFYKTKLSTLSIEIMVEVNEKFPDLAKNIECIFKVK